jgi:hypothetical protein
MHILNKWRAAWRFVSWNRWPEPVDWTHEDARNLEAFLAGQTGRRLVRQLGNGVVSSNANIVISANGKEKLDYLAGDANGFRRCVCYLEALAGVEDDVKTTETSAEDSGFRAS